MIKQFQTKKKIRKARSKNMLTTTLIMFVFAAVLTIAAYSKEPGLAREGLSDGLDLFLTILPVLVLAMVVAGMMPKVLPREAMSRWLGEESGLFGMLIATAAGALTPGGPFIQFPLVAGLIKAGAGVAQMMAYITAWSILGLNRFLIFEVPILGWKLALSRMAAGLVFPIIVGYLTRLIYVST